MEVMNMEKIDFDDKDLAIICLTILGVLTIILKPEMAEKILIGIVGAIAGFVTGRKLEKSE